MSFPNLLEIIIIDSSDIRPTFLFWARGRPVALMRGANRPLLTKLIHQEVDLEIRQGLRSLNVEVDFHSDKVIQVGNYFIYHKRYFSIEILEAEKDLDFVCQIWYS